MRLVTFSQNGSSAPGVVQGSGLLPLAPIGYSDALAFIAAGEPARRAVQQKLVSISAKDLLPFSVVRLLGPIPHPPKILCIGLNYRDHALESKMEIPAVPTVFAKFSTAVIGPDAPIVLPRFSKTRL